MTAQDRPPAGYHLTYDLSVPSALANFDVSTYRVARHGGATRADQEFRAELFARVGAVTIAGGAVETAMKRLLLLLSDSTGSGSFSLVDKPWSTLHKELRARCSAADSRRRALSDVLDWGEEHGVKERRDNVVHAYWWLFAGCGVRRGRFFHKTDGTTLIGSLEDLDKDAEVLFEYARRLDDLLGGDWPQAMLPATGADAH